MGWIIRFIKNRDRAVENIVMAVTRKNVLSQVPWHIVKTMRARLERVGAVLPPSSILAACMDPEDKATAGTFGVSLKSTKRNTKLVHRVPPQLQRLMSNGSGSRRVERMTAGVTINGRKFWAGSHCEFALSVSRARPHEANSPSKFKVGTVDAFYVVRYGERRVDVFVKLQVHTTHSVEGDIYQLHDTELSQLDTTYLHVDRLTYKVKRAPHWTDDNLWCGIRMCRCV